MSRLRSSMVLLGICILALLVGALRLVTEPTPLPVGSSYSAEPDGALGLYAWSEAVGGRPSRLTDPGPAGSQAATTLLVLQPESPVDPAAALAFDMVPDGGGTLVVAGDSLPWLLYVRGLGVTVEPIRGGALSASTPDAAITLHVAARYRLRARVGTPLLVTPDGDWLALRMAYGQGALVVLATPALLTNAALEDPQTARFVYRQILPTAVSGGALAFDEAHHSFAPPSVGPATLNQLLFATSPGRTVIYASLVVFGYLLLSGRRLGPPLLARAPAETRRTMYEHVQMLADLYRRARQLSVVRAAFSRHYQRLLARGGAGSPQRTAALSAALGRIEAARSESDLVAAVAAAES